ncbi:unnamed protein product [Calypogeia fissa]
MDASKVLRPELWKTLPNALIDIIIRQVLIDLPFSKLYTFCRFCKRWKDFLLSTTHYLLYFHMGEFKVFNCRRGLWETISLQFCRDQVGGLRLQNLRLVTSFGGLLCLWDTVNHEHIVCNPFTKCCTRLAWPGLRWLPRYTLPSPKSRELAGTRVVVLSTWSATTTTYINQDVLTVYQWNIEGDVRGLVFQSSGYVDSRHRHTIVHEFSRLGRPSWKQSSVLGVRDGFCFFVDGPVMLSPRRLTLGFYRGSNSHRFLVLIYDLNRRQCRWIVSGQPNICHHHSSSRRSSSNAQLVGTMGVGNQLEFKQMGDTGLHTAAVAFPPASRSPLEALMPRISRGLREVIKASEFVQTVYVEQDGVAFLVSMVAGSLRGPYKLIAVWRHCRTGKKELISEWRKEWVAPQCRWPFHSSFHVFTPSFTCSSCRSHD